MVPIIIYVLLLSLKDKHSPVPIISPVDPIDRLIDFKPTKAPYDPRWMLAGRVHPSKCILRLSLYQNFLTRVLIEDNVSSFFSHQGGMAEWVLWPWKLHGDHAALGTDRCGRTSKVTLFFTKIRLNLSVSSKSCVSIMRFIFLLCRLGGIPLGVIAVETRTVEMAVPADPANPESEAKVVLLTSLK